MTRANAFVGLGSNLARPEHQLQAALQAMAELPDTMVVSCSGFYASKPMGPQDQPDFVNAVAKLETALSPLDLLHNLQAIELANGRVRKEQQWGPRTLDLDILLMDDLRLNTEELTIPHYGMKNREFVLYPLAEIQPDLILPCGTSLESVLQMCPENGLRKLQHSTETSN